MKRSKKKKKKRTGPIRHLHSGICPNCGKRGSHFIPPCFGDPGYFTCKPGKGMKKGDNNADYRS